MRLGVNIDHVATLRQARQTFEPDPLRAALIAQDVGVDQITVHLRMDRRHIQDDDLEVLKSKLKIPLNVEMSTRTEMRDIACRICPSKVTLVPERRNEVTTEGGLDLSSSKTEVSRFLETVGAKGIEVGIFLDPDFAQIELVAKLGIPEIELNTGSYADAPDSKSTQKELIRIQESAELARSLGLKVAAGHGLTVTNLPPILKIDSIEELNIGHHLVADSVFMGWEPKLRQVLSMMREV
ncbi:pyridoxine 5'-phosphate synthase [bacterium]|jgi:pyridoxine 5-phosphate synthase|nr:pyridoxine 5'-phosphate synthase [bacterium]